MFTRFLSVTALSVAAALPFVSSSPISSRGACPRQTASGVNVDDLASFLGNDVSIFVPDDNEFSTLTVRWSNLDKPIVNVAVVPKTEEDVRKTVEYANKNNVPILAYNGHHGSLISLGKMTQGIAIYMKELSSLKIADDGKTMTVGGGINSHNLTQTLWDAKKQAVTGTCECVSYLGPALGGGHGWLQGHHGLISDQFQSMNIVLADGTLKTITSSDDLWWGMLGAGHNFGIVTSVTSQIYDIEHTNWAIETSVFSGDSIEGVYDAANEHLIQDGKQANDIHQWSYWMNDATVSEDPVIVVYTIQEGVDAVDSKYTQAFNDLNPLKVTKESGSYLDLGAWTNIALDSPPCQDFGFNNPRFPVYTKSYNSTAMRAAWEIYAPKIKGADNPYTNSIFMFEDYASSGIRDGRADDSTAFGFRQDRILAAPLIIYNSTGAAEDKSVADLGNQLREIIREGTGVAELHTYVNYAYGDEGPKAWYGWEDSRQERLKSLKTKYDPKGVFSFYAPIA